MAMVTACEAEISLGDERLLVRKACGVESGAIALQTSQGGDIVQRGVADVGDPAMSEGNEMIGGARRLARPSFVAIVFFPGPSVVPATNTGNST